MSGAGFISLAVVVAFIGGVLLAALSVDSTEWHADGDCYVRVHENRMPFEPDTTSVGTYCPAP